MAGSKAHSFDRGLPEPPYSTELLADYHAGALDPVTAEHVRGRLPADPHAHEVLDALDRVRGELRGHGQTAPPMPDAVAERLDALIDDLTDC